MRRDRPFAVLHTLRSLAVNGITSVVLRNVEQLARRGVRSHVCAMYDDDRMARAFRDLGVEPVFLGHTGVATAARSVRRLTRLLRREAIDVVHANQTVDLFLAGVAARRRGVPVVASIHWLAEADTSALGAGPRAAGRAKQWVRLLADRGLATRIVAVSGAVRDTHTALLGAAFPVDRVEVVFPGIDMDAEPPAAEVEAERRRVRRELGVTAADPLLLNIGRLHPVKGQLHLMPMMRLLRERLPHATLVVAGGGPLRPELERAITEHGVGDRVRLLGARLDVPSLLRASDALVLASESEAAPLPLMEAMRAGKPLVATRVGGVPEMVEDGVTGFVVPPADPGALADGVAAIFASPERARTMGEAGRRLARERFDVARLTARLEEIYRELALSPAPPSRSTTRPRRRSTSPAR